MSARFRGLLVCFWITVLALVTGAVAAPAVSAGGPPSAVSAVSSANGANTAATAVAYSPDGRTLAAGTSGSRLHLYSTSSGVLERSMEGHKGSVTAVAFSPDGKTLASAGRDSTVRLWDPSSGKLTRTLEGHEQAVRAIAFTADGAFLISGGEDSRSIVWNVATGRLEQVLSGNNDFVTAVATSPTGAEFATATRDARIRIWDSRSRTEVRTLRGHAGEVTSLAFAPDGTTLASGSADASVKVWTVSSGAERLALRGHSGRVATVAFQRNGTTIVSGGADGALRLWNARTGVVRRSITDSASPVESLALSPDGARLVDARQDGAVRTWEADNGRMTRSVSPPPARPTQPASPNQSRTQPPATSKTAAELAAGDGGPILVVTTAADSLDGYYAEILRAEGLNEFATADVSTVTPASLAAYDVVILAARTLSAAQVTTVTDWVTGGGNLIAMRPQSQLAALLGLSPRGTTLAEGYLRVDTTSAPGAGIVGETIQYHGTADRYALAGARNVAALHTDATTATTDPALSLRNVGSQGGQAAAFTYDLARSVVLTRQGNPAWEGQERDGVSPVRSDDLYFGAASGDPRTDWVNLNKVSIPQADEHQRLLANLILEMNRDRKPLPRFWYLPRAQKAAVVMTGDDHGNGGTAARFDEFAAASPPGCSVADWECIRGTSYVYPSTPLSNAQATSYTAQGFEVGLHASTSCADYTPASLRDDFTSQLAAFATKYTGIPAPNTSRTHCIAWSDWSTQATVELENSIRLDTNYYYWPPSWLQDRPGLFTGSGMPMRFANTNGALVDVYQATTQLTDESGQSYPGSINALLDKAIGSQGYYGVFTVNAHTDADSSNEATSVVASAKARGVPVVTAKQMLTWLDGRNASSFGDMTWNGGQLSFSVAPGAGANGLDIMVPVQSTAGALDAVTQNGSAVTYTTRVVKGVQYAFFRAAAGTFVATYQADTTAPTVSSTSPANGATGVAQGTAVTATFSEPVDAGTITGDTVQLRNGSGALVGATVSYDSDTRTARLQPSVSLGASTTYTATVQGGAAEPTIRDLSGSPLGSDVTWAFTTASGPACPCTIWPSTATPASPVDNDPNAVQLGVRFRSDIDGFISGVRFWKGAPNTGTHTGSLWTTGGTRLATAVFTNETASGWQQVSFASPVAVTAGTTYVASYHTTSGNYAGDNNTFATQGVDRAPLHALRDGADGANGVYAYGPASSFPNSTWRSSNYWVDVVFTTTAPPDTTAPTVTSTVPAPAATGVARASTVTATFDEPVNPATVSGSTFELTGPGGAVIPASVSYDAGTRTATLDPDATLAPSTSYTARVRGGASGPRVTDIAGNALATDRVWSFTTAAPGLCDNPTNNVVAENCLTGNPASEWDVSGAGDATIQGFATDISVNRGTTVSFKIDTTATAYRVDIYRLGYYGGLGARKIATILAGQVTATNQPACITQPGTGLIDCGNWSTSSTWNVPVSAASGVYIARPVRSDNGGASHIPFIVRDDGSHSDVVFQTSDTTWQAYNTYGGNSLYTGSPDGRAYKVSYNRPFVTRSIDNGQDWLFNAEYPMIRWLERNGFDVSYTTGVDSDRRGDLITQHKTFLSVGHDEYWSGTQRANVEAARNNGVNLAFLSGNEVFWKTRWEPSVDGSGTAHRTLVTYKETHAGAKIDPSPEWTGTWRDPRFSPPSNGNRPENNLTGTIFMVNDGATTSIRVPEADGKMRFWRGTSVATQASGATATLPNGTLGYEWDSDLDNGARPNGLIRMSSTTVTSAPILLDHGSTYGSGTATHNLTLYRRPGGGLVFGAGTVQWSWGLDSTHDRGSAAASVPMQQATVNLLADMGAQPATIATGLTPATASTDTASASASITAPVSGAVIAPGTAVTISGTATDAAGRVGGVEVSTDNGASWHPATGRGSWTYGWTAGPAGQVTIRARATDDSGNTQTTPASATVTVGSAPPPAAPSGLTATATATGVLLDWANNTEPNLAGYAVYRASSAAGPFTRLTPAPVTASAWEDTLAPVGTSYYRVAALNTTGGESGPSPTSNASMAKANRLLNPGFEDDTNGDSRPDSWTSSARFTRSTASVHSGAFNGRHNGPSNNNYTISQDRTWAGLAGGTTYDFAAWVNIPATSDTFTFRFDIQWRNASNAVIGTQTVATYTSATSGWVKASGSYLAPAGTARIRVNMVASSLSATVHVDDLTFR